MLAERNGLRIHEVPVDWVDDPDSRVDVASTAKADMRGIVRLLRRFARGDGTTPTGIGRSARGRVHGTLRHRTVCAVALRRLALSLATVAVLASAGITSVTAMLAGVILVNAAATKAKFVLVRTWVFGVPGRSIRA